MPEQTDVKVFISWSGELAKGVAIALRDWLPLLFDRVAPWASDTDIAAGQRGLAQIEAELGNTRFGIVVVTAANQHAPWLNFEAGALSRIVVGDLEHRVVPLLVDLSGPTQVTGPLAQFQAKTAQREGMLDVVRSLAAVAGIEVRVASARFEVYWPQLETAIEAAKASVPRSTAKQTKRGEEDVLDEILLHVRALRADSSVPTKPKVRDRGDRGFHMFLDNWAEKHDLVVQQYPEGEGNDSEVVVAPRGVFSQADVDAFAQDVWAHAAPPDQKVQVRVNLS